MKRLILDEKTWRCGRDSDNPKNRRGAIGTPTALLNKQGRLCCIGQFSLQLDKSLKKKDLLSNGEACELNRVIPGFTEKDEEWDNYYDTPLMGSAYSINDDENTSVGEKVKLLKELFLEEGFKIVFKKRK